MIQLRFGDSIQRFDWDQFTNFLNFFYTSSTRAKSKRTVSVHVNCFRASSGLKRTQKSVQIKPLKSLELILKWFIFLKSRLTRVDCKSNDFKRFRSCEHPFMNPTVNPTMNPIINQYLVPLFFIHSLPLRREYLFSVRSIIKSFWFCFCFR